MKKYQQINFELSKKRIQHPLKKGELYFLIQYYHDERPYRYYMAAKSAEQARELFNEQFGSQVSPCTIHDIKPERGNDQSRLVVYSNVVEMLDDISLDKTTVFRRIGVKFNMSANAVQNLYYKIRKGENE